MTQAIVKADSLLKRFPKKGGGQITAVDNLSFEIGRGEIYGLIGPNGSGKTTTIKMLSTLIIPDSGNASIMGHDVVSDEWTVKTLIGASVGEFSRTMYWRLTARENLMFFARLKNVEQPEERIARLLDAFALSEHGDEMVMKFSMGMKHKLSIARALLTDPPVVFLDEPLTGIDPISAFEIKKLIRTNLKEKSILWTTHNLYEIEEMCDRIAVINRGSKVLEGSPVALREQFWGYEKIVIKTPNPQSFTHIDGSVAEGNMITVKTANVPEMMTEIGKVTAEGVPVTDIQTLKPTLEEIFVKAVSDKEAGNEQ